MMIFTCGGSYEDAASCIYSAWEYALKVGHDDVRIVREPVAQLDMFAEYVQIGEAYIRSGLPECVLCAPLLAGRCCGCGVQVSDTCVQSGKRYRAHAYKTGGHVHYGACEKCQQ